MLELPLGFVLPAEAGMYGTPICPAAAGLFHKRDEPACMDKFWDESKFYAMAEAAFL